MASDVKPFAAGEAEARVPAPQSRASHHRPLRISCWAVALTLGAWQAWATRFAMNPDGVSYLDIGDAYWRGDWPNAINAYWSPLYSWILGFFLGVVKPSIYWEYPLVHLVNFLIYVAALACFEFFLTSFIREELSRRSDERCSLFPEWFWWIAGYSAFVVSAINVMGIDLISPDMLIAAIIYLASAVLLRIYGGKSGWRMFALLGLLLSFGYLTKAVMFVMSAIFVGVAAMTRATWRERIRSTTVGFVFFAVVAAPLVIVLSFAKGRPTFGDSGKINYEINVGTTQFFIPAETSAKHPIRRLDAIPEAYEYASPIAGTYPPWYDPSYWHEGIQSHFDLWRQIRTFLLAMAQCLWILFNVSMGLCISVVICVLYLLSEDIQAGMSRARHWWVLWLPALAGIGLYSLVVIEPRYVGAQFCLLWIVAFSGIAMKKSGLSMRLLSSTVFALGFLTCATAGYQIWRAQTGRTLAERDVATPECEEVATALAEHGLRPGDKIALVSEWLFPSRRGAYIARLDRLKIIGEARSDQFWAADDASRSKLMSEFRSYGAAAVLTYRPPQVPAGWERVGQTQYYFTVVRHEP